MLSKKRGHYFPNLPIKPIKYILKKYHKGEVSEDACYYVKDLLLEFTEILAEEAEKQFKDSNNDRKKHGIPKLKRLNKYTFIDIRNRFFKRINISNMGEVEKEDKILLCQDGATNE